MLLKLEVPMQIIEASQFTVVDDVSFLVPAPLQFVGFADQFGSRSRPIAAGYAIDHIDAAAQFRGAVYETPTLDGSVAYLAGIQQGAWSDAGEWIEQDAPIMDDVDTPYSTAVMAARAADKLAKVDARVEYKSRLRDWMLVRGILTAPCSDS